MKNNFAKWKPYIFLAILLLSLIPLIWLGRYNYPTGDDYYYGAETHLVWQQTGSIIQTLDAACAGVADSYQIWQGTYSALFLMYPVALLTLFLKRSLGLLSQVTNTERIGALMITCEELDHRMLEVLTAATEGLHLKTDQICFQSHVESFYYYNLYQPEELWRHKTILCEYGDASIRTYCMECNRHTTPVVAYMEERDFPFPVPESDEKMQEIAKKLCENQMISSVYLIGEAFSRDWMKESLRYLCKGRRVFQGNNLFSKGACYGMMERLTPGETGKNHVFLGKDKLKSNIGMKVLRRGEVSYQALLDAGINWYEAKNTMEFYLLEGRAVEILITSLTGKGNRIARIVPEELQEGIIRLRISVEMRDDTHLKVELEDLGFGTFRAATHHIWKEEIEL